MNYVVSEFGMATVNVSAQHPVRSALDVSILLQNFATVWKHWLLRKTRLFRDRRSYGQIPSNPRLS